MIPPLYILDTNVLVHYVRDSGLWRSVGRQYDLLLREPTPLISTVTEGELRSLAIQRDWRAAKLDKMEFCLGYFRRMPIDDRRVFRAYADLDAATVKLGQAMGKNDLWIAATAVAFGATLLTTDSDFDRLVPFTLDRIRIDPSAGGAAPPP